MLSGREFKSALLQEGYERLGLCMFAPVAVASIVNRRLNAAYGDSGDNVSVPLGRSPASGIVEYLAGNYMAAALEHALPTIDIFEKVPGCVLLVTHPGVGQQSVP